MPYAKVNIYFCSLNMLRTSAKENEGEMMETKEGAASILNVGSDRKKVRE